MLTNLHTIVRRRCFAGTLATLAATLMVVAAATGNAPHASSSADYVPGAPSPTVTGAPPINRAGVAPSPALTSRFAVFRQAQTAADHLGHRNGGALASSYFDDQSHAAMAAAPLAGPGHATDSAVYIAGGPEDTVCLLELPPDADGPGGQCTSSSVAAEGRSILTQERAAPGSDGVGTGGGIDIMGIVPDGVARVTVTLIDGETTTLPVHGNVYAANMPVGTRSVSFSGPGGPRTFDAPSG